MSDRASVNAQEAAENEDEEKDGKDRRRFHRSTVVWAGELVTESSVVDCVVLNISVNGAKVQLSKPYQGSDTVTLKMPRFGDFEGDVVWRSGNSVGVKFRTDPKIVATIIGEAVPQTREDV